MNLKMDILRGLGIVKENISEDELAGLEVLHPRLRRKTEILMHRYGETIDVSGKSGDEGHRLAEAVFAIKRMLADRDEIRGSRKEVG